MFGMEFLSEIFTYYADGEKITLSPSPNLLAVHKTLLSEEDAAKSKPLKEDFFLCDVDNVDLSSSVGPNGAWLSTDKTHPVLLHGNAVLIPYPEIRVEDPDESKLDRIETFIRKFAATMFKSCTYERTPEMLTIKYEGSGAFAMAISKLIYESAQFSPQSSTPKFVRVLNKN